MDRHRDGIFNLRRPSQQNLVVMDAPKKEYRLATALVTAAGDGSGRAGLINREVRHGSENSSVRLASWRWPRVRRNDCGSEFRFDPRGSPGQLSARPSVCSSGEQMRGVRRSGASPKMSAGPGVRRKHEPLRVGAITLDRGKNGEISGKQGNTLVRTLHRVHGPNFAEGFKVTDNR